MYMPFSGYSISSSLLAMSDTDEQLENKTEQIFCVINYHVK